ncbi:MAG: YbhB/YbcL family Raf kinase inhibitor-like protein [Treponema sp.]|jgi:Raf kinase inhibitor-like YbhB/YbcL family protein|nr:YbhB/YbcL family Raf kinase inhibitor-like protein [Treponema sp.]
MKRTILFVLFAFLLFSSLFVLGGCDNGNGNSNSNSPFKLTSSAFKNNQRLADKYCYTGVKGGQNISLPFNWVQPPENTQSFALILYDPDGANWIHWAVFNIPVNSNSIAENASGTNMPTGSVELENEFGSSGYGGPEPPAGSGTHRYIATLYALNTTAISGLGGFKSYADISAILSGKVIDKASLTGTYSR